jgi:hypothetical protein
MNIKPKIVYITGYGRSGSTVLGTILGTVDRARYVGELFQMPFCFGPEHYCSCGQLVNDCGFWSRIYATWEDRTGASLERFRDLSIKYEGTGVSVWRRLLSERTHISKEFLEYAFLTESLFKVIAEITESEYIVDSSKSAQRAFAMSLMGGIDLSLIHLVRDGRSVVASLRKRFRKDPERGIPKDIRPIPSLRAAAGWMVKNLESEFVRRGIPAETQITLFYEDVVTDLDGHLERLSKIFGRAPQELHGRRSFPISHIIEGSRIRMKGSVEIKSDYVFSNELSAIDRGVFWLSAGILALKYGYRPFATTRHRAMSD